MKLKLILAVILALVLTPIIGALVWMVVGTAVIYVALNRKKIQAFLEDAKEIVGGKHP